MFGFVSSGWSSLVNALSRPVQDLQKEAAIKQKLLEIKQIKKTRDIELSTKIATTRDRVWWMAAFYVTMGAVSLARVIYLRQISPLPLRNVPYVLVPFMVFYQADFAYGTKSERINNMAKHIREKEDYWFNEPLELPYLLKDPYFKLMEETNNELEKQGQPKERHWGK